jgi:hypothetical protein
MTNLPPQDGLVELSDITSATMPVALLSKEPSELIGQGAREFRDSFDDLDYLMFSVLELSAERQVALVHYQNSPTSGTHLCITQSEENVVAILSEAMKVLKLSKCDFSWVHPDYENEFMIMQSHQNNKSLSVKNDDNNLTFSTAATMSNVSSLKEIIEKSFDNFDIFSEKVLELVEKINQTIKLDEVDLIITYIDLINEYKSNMTKMLSWTSVGINAINCLVSSLDSELLGEYISTFEKHISTTEETLSTILLHVSSSLTVFGISLNPDQRQISETKATIAGIHSQLELIKDADGENDWGMVEKNAYERMQENRTDNVSGEEFLNWLSSVEQGCEV